VSCLTTFFVMKLRHFVVYYFIISSLVSTSFEQPKLWPQPQSVTAGSNQAIISSRNFRFRCIGKSCSEVLTHAFERYRKYIFVLGESNSTKSQITSLLVDAAAATPLELGMDESYTLIVNATTALLKANTEWGALRGLETFSQLVDFRYELTEGNHHRVKNLEYFVMGLPIHINDAPRFKWRALLIDTSRHYLTVSTILRALDAMSFNKMNVLHWHVVDDQSFPLASQKYPLLSEKGAWAPYAVYDSKTVQRIIEYARLRGIRVVPEFDTPAHAYSWSLGYPFLIAKCPGVWPVVFDATSEQVYQFLTNFMTEMTHDFFKDQFIHMGGDEVAYGCWRADHAINQWMASHNMSSYEQLQGYYENRIQNILRSLGKTTILYEESYDHSVDGGYKLLNDTIVDVWLSINELANVVKAGYRVIYAKGWYLDQQIPNPNMVFYLWEDTWKNFYLNEPIPDNLGLTPEQKALVLGGEASMWGEQVDHTCFDVRVWPRACATAERLWSQKHVNSTDEATGRLGMQRCRMVRRGISAGPIYPDHCDLGPYPEL
jgi:hexosaminidase